MRSAQRRDASGVLTGILFGSGITFGAQAIVMRGSMSSSGFFAMSFFSLGMASMFYADIGFGPPRRYYWFAASAFAGMIFSILEGVF